MNPTSCRRNRSRSPSVIAAMSRPSTSIRPDVGSSAPARQRSVLLPLPDGPTMNVNFPRGIEQVTPPQNRDLDVPAVVRLDEIFDLNHWGRTRG